MVATTTEYENLSREELVATIKELTSQLLKFHALQHELDQLKRLVFGSRHERFVPSTPPEQLALGLTAETVQPSAAPVQTIEYTRKKKEASEKIHTGRMKLPADLPREQVIIEPKEDVSGLKKIGEDIPNENELKVATLNTMLTDLRAKNTGVINATTTASNARIARDKALYAEVTGMVDTALDVKTYVKSVFGASSPQYKQVSALKFTKRTGD